MQRGAALLAHRGPDDMGCYLDGAVGMIHHRLSVIDLSQAGHQPMANEDGLVQLVYNGEVYNFRELRRQHRLDEKYTFRSRTDTEVVLHLYEEKGIDCFSELDGMFAFAVWDGQKRELILARDIFGIKPIFYIDDGVSFWFASEIKAFLAAGIVEPRPDINALARYLQFDYIPGELTAFNNIRKLRPGHWLRVKEGGLITEKAYWSWPARTENPPSLREAVEKSRWLLREAVERQLVSDVPIGVMLSGGMDSSTLTALMAEVREAADFHTFSLAFEDPTFDESSYAALVANKIGTFHHIIPVTPAAVWNAIPHQVAHIDEPYADGSAIPTYLLSQYARDFVTVLLSGEGGDEIFAGYDTHLAYKVREIYLRTPRIFRRLLNRLVHTLPVSHRKLALEFRLKRFVQAAENDPAAAHFFWRAVATESMVSELTGIKLDPADNGADLFQHIYNKPPTHNPIGRLTRIDGTYHLPDDLMVKCDRMTMAFSLEARVPFTDLSLVRYVMSLPDRVRLPGFHQKYLLRQAMAGVLPNAIVRKKKVGMEIPYSRWFCNEWRERAEVYFATEKASCGGVLNAVAVRKYWNEHLNKVADHGRLLWGLLNYIFWYDLYIAHPGDYAEQTQRARPALGQKKL